MKSTGIVRKIDELRRIVILMELKRTLEMKRNLTERALDSGEDPSRLQEQMHKKTRGRKGISPE